MSVELASEVMTFYASTVDESVRLSSSADGRLEMLRTQELLRRYLPSAPACVLDVGGGPGAHARWLVEDGYSVHLVDPVPRHVETARQVATTAELGDARDLGGDDAEYDAVLVLGPLYHLLERDDRDRALAEAYRLVKPGGLVAAAGINRYASLFEHTAFAHLYKDGVRESIESILASRVHDGKQSFTAAYFHSGAELREEVAAAGFVSTEVFGIEGPTWGMLKATEQYTKESVIGSPLFESALAAARMAEPYPELLAASSHMLTVGRRPARPAV
ncbi:methyltransferase domain-containing protein [Streptomyces diacarni]|uniref:class I SAM-dependent methyltransferase n=1 Tax=Streptomyces diacarni TaxID=2800381 RepID=UPI0033E1FF8B